MEFVKSRIKFKVNSRKISFSIIHNLPESFGLSINDALNSWICRTEKYTDESLVNYINSKKTGCVAMTEKQYRAHFIEIQKNIKKK